MSDAALIEHALNGKGEFSLRQAKAVRAACKNMWFPGKKMPQYVSVANIVALAKGMRAAAVGVKTVVQPQHHKTFVLGYLDKAQKIRVQEATLRNLAVASRLAGRLQDALTEALQEYRAMRIGEIEGKKSAVVVGTTEEKNKKDDLRAALDANTDELQALIGSSNRHMSDLVATINKFEALYGTNEESAADVDGLTAKVDVLVALVASTKKNKKDLATVATKIDGQLARFDQLVSQAGDDADEIVDGVASFSAKIDALEALVAGANKDKEHDLATIAAKIDVLLAHLHRLDSQAVVVGGATNEESKNDVATFDENKNDVATFAAKIDALEALINGANKEKQRDLGTITGMIELILAHLRRQTLAGGTAQEIKENVANLADKIDALEALIGGHATTIKENKYDPASLFYKIDKLECTVRFNTQLADRTIELLPGVTVKEVKDDVAGLAAKMDVLLARFDRLEETAVRVSSAEPVEDNKQALEEYVTDFNEE